MQKKAAQNQAASFVNLSHFTGKFFSIFKFSSDLKFFPAMISPRIKMGGPHERRFSG
jgi:hypothetical protein